MKKGFVYILGNHNITSLYIGVTSDLVKRIYEHKNKLVKGFTNEYNINMLLYYEVFDDIKIAIEREKQLKNWHRQWKINLIKSQNTLFKDLYDDIL